MQPRQMLDRLCERVGIAHDYSDIWGKRHRTPVQTKRALLAAMGYAVEGKGELAAALAAEEERPWRRWLAPVRVVREDETPLTLEAFLPADLEGQSLTVTVTLESGDKRQQRLKVAELASVDSREVDGTTVQCRRLELEPVTETGYHELELAIGRQKAATTLIVTPRQGYSPPTLDGEGRVWGPALQLYGVRSQHNWGIGDFSDLGAALEQAAEQGADVVGVNPLHALFPHNPDHTSPYSPSSRLWLNVLYLDLEAVPDYGESAPAREMVQDPQFQARLRALRAAEMVQYREVHEVKFPVLEVLYRHFRERHLGSSSRRGRAFRDFCRQGGESLEHLALFEALQAHLHAQDAAVWGWPVWPEEYRDPEGAAVRDFARSHRERVEFYQYLQWQADLQLAGCGRRAKDLGLGVGLYQDLAVSINDGGAEAWAHRELYALGARVGAPPDEFSPKGQDWGLPPLIPQRLRETAYRPFIDMLRANMRHAGALRIDHVMGLVRLYWVPVGMSADQGAYVAYPYQDLLGIVALESQRNRCLVIGEDLGTVPEELRETAGPLGVLSYRLLYFERDEQQNFLAPQDYPQQALVAVSTHDLPTLSGWWSGTDIDARAERHLFPDQALRRDEIVRRSQDRARLLVALEAEGLLPADLPVHPVSVPEMTPELARAIHLYLARSPSRVMMVQPEDIFGQHHQVNLPGTTDQYPNWRRKLTLNLEDWGADSRVQALGETLRAERAPPQRRPAAPPAGAPRGEAVVPASTYRLQMHAGFTFRQAGEIVPYLAELGISHAYFSPFLRARPGSTHGYDIIGHDALNPEIGTRADYDKLSKALAKKDIGQILDIVPNHMGVGSDNPWWLDVLENGPAAVHAPYFDIDWRPFREELRNKVLLPVLGDQYGVVLESGQLELRFEPESGSFDVWYYEHRFPIDPASYPLILGHRLETLETRLGPDDPWLPEYQALINGFGHLPGHFDSDPERVAERQRDAAVHKRRLAEQVSRSPDIDWFIRENLKDFNGIQGEPASFDALDRLLQVQAHRPAYWRVAADDINYRRFFDINDLAGLRMEHPPVFRDTHRLILELLESGHLQGLRIDHPDGLYNPVQYFQQLQETYAGQRLPAEGGHGEEDKPLYLVVEKILESYERLPEHWPVHGTTGYEFANAATALLVNPQAEEAFDRIYSEFIGGTIDFEALLYNCKKLIIRSSLASELNVLANRLRHIALADRRTRDFTLNTLRYVLREVVACFPVYRTYITDQGPNEEDRRYIDWAVSVARKRSTTAETSIFDFVREALLTEISEGKNEAFRAQVLAFAMKFQQYTGPVMAKGLEDTGFYRYHRLVALNEVGGDPLRFGTSVNAFHHGNQARVRRWPHGMLNTSTHDSKRSEDVRARIAVLSELPEEWERNLTRWSRLNERRKRLVDDQPAPSRNDEYLLYQTLLGAWPLEALDEAGLETYRGRIRDYMIKAIREAKEHSSWVNVNGDYEGAVTGFVDGLLEGLDKNRFLSDFLPFKDRLTRFGLFNALSQVLLKLTSPGVPDIYQGTELWDFSLVDPDNRRPVDYDQRNKLLKEVKKLGGKGGAAKVKGLLDDLPDGRAKFYLVWRVLNLRRQNPEPFRDGDYQPLTVIGERAEHICAFARRHGERQVIVVAPRLYATLLGGDEQALPLGAVWGEDALELPEGGEGGWKNLLTGESLSSEAPREGKSRLELARVLESFPVAVLVRE